MSEPTEPGPGPRWSGDGGLRPRSSAAARADSAEETSALPPPVASASSAGAPPAGAVVLPAARASVVRRAVALFGDAMIKFALLQLLLTLGGIPLDTELTPGLAVAVIILSRGYDWIFFTQGWTPGGRPLGLVIVRVDGSPMTARVGLIRAAASILSDAALGLGYFWAIVDRERRTAHDRIAGTVVLHIDRRAGR